MTISHEDFFLQDDELSSSEKQFRLKVRSFLEKEVKPSIEKWFLEGAFPPWLPEALGELGVLGRGVVTFEAESGTVREYLIAMTELERVDSGLRSFVSVQSALAMNALASFGGEEIRKKWLPKMRSGSLIGAFALTEPNIGSNPRAIETKFEKVDGGYKLTGRKRWVTNGSVAHVFVVWAKEADGQMIRGFVVPRKAKGLRVAPIDNKLSLRVSDSAEIELEQTFVPEENGLNTEGLKNALKCLHKARLGIAFGVVGAAEACLAEALSVLETRSPFGRPLSSHQLVQAKLVKVFSGIQAAKALNAKVLALFEQKKELPAHVSLIKLENVKMALESARICRDLLGANGITQNHCVIRHMLNLETVSTYEGTSDIHRLVLGQYLTGRSAFS